MSAEKAAAVNAPEAHKGVTATTANANGESKREVSTIQFPYLDLDDGVAIAKGVHAVGASCQWDQLAAHLGETDASSSNFRFRVQTAKMYGLVKYDRTTITLTPLGTKISDPLQEKSAKVEAFLMVPLYKAVYDKFRGATLPPSSGLENVIGDMGVATKQRAKARQVFQRSATEAGFFAFGTDRLVMPSIKGAADSSIQEPAEKKKSDHDDELDDEKGKDQKRDPIIEGLIKRLPEPGLEWPAESRKRWLQAASNIFDLIYTDKDGNTVIVEFKTSAK